MLGRLSDIFEPKKAKEVQSPLKVVSPTCDLCLTVWLGYRLGGLTRRCLVSMIMVRNLEEHSRQRGPPDSWRVKGDTSAKVDKKQWSGKGEELRIPSTTRCSEGKSSRIYCFPSLLSERRLEGHCLIT